MDPFPSTWGTSITTSLPCHRTTAPPLVTPYYTSPASRASIDDIIIDIIYEIRQPIMDIAHFDTSEDPTDFQEEDTTFFDFLKTQVGGSGPPEPPEINFPLDSIPSP